MRPHGVIVFCNAAMGRLIVQSPAECIGRNVVEWLHPDELERAGGLMSLSNTEQPPAGMSRFKVVHSDGTWVPLEISAAAVWDCLSEALVDAADGALAEAKASGRSTYRVAR